MSHMDRALSLARRALGSVSPNPAVGALVVKDGLVVGEGWSQPPGQDHAEVVALRQAGADAEGATLYTTLEPCCHHGRTPPCTTAIARAGIVEVHAALVDPNPLVNGGGIARLRRDGIRTECGERAAQAAELVEAYLKFIATGLPFVTAKFAMTLDGKIATRTGESKWITGGAARACAQALRLQSDVVMVGVNTVIADDPRLTARDETGAPRDRQPLRVVVDSRGRTPADARLLSQKGESLVATCAVDEARRLELADAGAQVETLPGADGAVDVAALLELLAAWEKPSVLVEGGGSLLGAMFDRGLIDKVVAFVAPVIVGGEEAPSPVRGVGIGGMSDALRLHRVRVRQIDDDLLVTGYTRPLQNRHSRESGNPGPGRGSDDVHRDS